MRRALSTLCSIALLALTSCGDASDKASATDTGGAATATAAQGAAPVAPPVNLLAFAAGAQIVDKPEDNKGIFMMSYDPINLIDESLDNDWSAKADVPAVIVFELPERTELEKLGFDSAGVSREDKSPKSVLVEVSDTSMSDGYQPILATDLKKATDNQDFAVTAKVPGRWVRLTVKSNYGDDYVGMVEFRGYGKQLTHDAALTNVSGTYEGYSGWGKVHLKQEGSRVTGCYEYESGIISGGVEGRLLKASMIETSSDGRKSRQLGLFSFSPENKKILGLTREEGAEPGSLYSSYYAGEKLSDDIGDCPNIPDWKGKAAQSQLGNELESVGRARLDGVNFDFNSATIRPESKPLLDQVAELLKSRSNWAITLEGHTDNIGGAAFNKALSEQRAAAVKAYLVSKGVPEERLSAAGFGFDKPVASNDGEGGRSQNRRVEIVRR